MLTRMRHAPAMHWNIKSARIAAYTAQRGRCTYCRAPMWESQIESREDAQARFSHRWWPLAPLEPPEAGFAKMRCTAEHVVPRSEGGNDEAANIVAACAFCNGNRGSMAVEAWRERLAASLPVHQIGDDPMPQLDGLWQSQPWAVTWQHILHVECSAVAFFLWHIETRDEWVRFAHSDVLMPQQGGPAIVPGFRIILASEHLAEATRRHFGSRVV